MFCSECGKENPNTAKYCCNCGTSLQGTSQPQKVVTLDINAKSESKETTYYSDNKDVRITNSRAIFGNKTYVMSNISSISLGEIPPNYNAAIVIFIVGFITSFVSLSFAAAIILIGILIAAITKGQYTVKITSASGETNALSDTDKSYIQDIVNAMQEAIIKRG